MGCSIAAASNPQAKKGHAMSDAPAPSVSASRRLLTIPEVLQQIPVSRAFLYKMLNDAASGLKVRRYGRRVFVTQNSVDRCIALHTVPCRDTIEKTRGHA